MEIVVNRIPDEFTYSNKTENLFLFYQRATELLFEFSPDSYKVSLHNAHSIAIEAYNIFLFLKKDNSIARFYSQYIPDIIEELIQLLKDDTTAKELLGYRYNKYLEIFEQSKNAKGTDVEAGIFESNIRNFLNLFAGRKYYNLVCKNLAILITGEKNQQEIINLTNIFIRELITLGYSKEHIQNVILKYFKTPIDDPNVGINKLFELFTFEEKSWDIITFVNTKLYGYYQDELYKVIKSDDLTISNLDEEELDELIKSNYYLGWLKKTVLNLNEADIKVSLIRASVQELDPYTAYRTLDDFIDTVNSIVTIFDNEKKIGYRSIACLNYEYKTKMRVRRSMEKRLKLNKENDCHAQRTATALKEMHMTGNVLRAFRKTAEFHGHALSGAMDEQYILVILWTSLESLFVDNANNAHKSDLVMDSLIAIIQRTYITKTLKYLQFDMLRHLRSSNNELIEKYSLDNINKFIDVMFSPPTDEAVKDISATLEKNPLLRTRLFMLFDNNYKTNGHILEVLEKHKKRIEWQIKRIYRTRNLVVHTGRSVPFIEDLVENLHNYVDFVLNFMVCKSWAGERITDIQSLITEVKVDNEVHYNMLSAARKEKTSEHVYESLFGPSKNILIYYEDSDI